MSKGLERGVIHLVEQRGPVKAGEDGISNGEVGHPLILEGASRCPRPVRAAGDALVGNRMICIDPDLIRALHLTTADHDGATQDAAAAHHVFQTSTVQALLDIRYEGDLTIAELLAHGDLALGTLDGLDGELIVADGAAYVARVNGSVVAVDGTPRTPFAVVTPFAPGPPAPVCGLDNAALLAEMDWQCRTTVAAVRVCGYFTRLRVRSVPPQQPPYPPLDRVVHDQVEWEIGTVDAVLVGFRFPIVAAGMEVPGWHLHALADDRTSGGHVLIADIAHGTVEVDDIAEVHVELPPGVDIAAADTRTAAAIHRAETATTDNKCPES